MLRLKTCGLALALLLGVARLGFAENLQFVLACDMPAEKLVYSYDARTSNVLYIIHNGWGGAIFEMHIFEDLLLPAWGWPTQHFFNGRRIDADLIEWARISDTRYDFHLRQQQVLNYDLAGSVTIQNNHVVVGGKITNMDTQTWSNNAGLMCLRCRLNSDFHDTTGERIFVFDKTSGARENILTAAGYNDNYPYFGFSFPWAPCKPRLQKVDTQLRRMVTLESDPCFSLMGNREEGISCIHANVRLDALPGETCRFTTTVTFDQIAKCEKTWGLYE